MLAIGVIAPLFYLSYGDRTARVVLLAGFILLATILVGYFGFELVKLRSAADLTRDTMP
jgi:hypothetical protein